MNRTWKGYSLLLGPANFMDRLTSGVDFVCCDAAKCGIHWVRATLERISSMVACGISRSVVCTSSILCKNVGLAASTQKCVVFVMKFDFAFPPVHYFRKRLLLHSTLSCTICCKRWVSLHVPWTLKAAIVLWIVSL